MQRPMNYILNIVLVAFMLPVINRPANAQNRQILLADSLYEHTSYYKAREHYEKALRRNVDPYVVREKLANTYFQLKEYDESEKQFYLALQNVENWSPLSKRNFLEVLRIEGKEQEVTALLASWDDLNNNQKFEEGIRAETLYYMDSMVYSVEPMPINSSESDFAPTYYKDGLVFTSARPEGNTGRKKYHWDGSNYLNMFYAPLAGAVENVEPIGENTIFHDGMACFYAYETKVIFTRNETGRDKESHRQLILMQADVDYQGKWFNIKPVPFNHKNYSVSHPAISNDGTVLYFVSDQPDGYGGTDIYRVKKEGNEWGTPENLGPDINTPGDELFPSLFNNELFFASDGHPGLGGLDIYEAEYRGDNRYMVRNAGFPVNSNHDDFGLITRTGKKGYFSSNRNGEDDIFEFEKDKVIVDIEYVDKEELLLDSVETINEGKHIQPLPGRSITHIYLKPNSYNAFQAHKKGYEDTTYTIKTQNEFYLTRTIPLTEHKVSSIDIYPIAYDDQVDFYLGLSDRLLLANQTNNWRENLNVTVVEDVTATNLLKGITGILENNGYKVNIHDTISSLHFDFDKSTIRKGEKSNLERLVQLLKKYPDARVSVGAHADKRGTNGYNDKLTVRRAHATADYLISNGISSDRIIENAYGERRLLIVCDECTEEMHQKNRRANFGIDPKNP